MTERRAAERHLDAVTVAGLGARERSLLVHVAGCVACRRRLLAEERDQLAPWTDPEADAAIRRLLRELECETGLDGKMAAIQRERREAVERVRELVARPDSWGIAATEPRYASIEVAWQVLEAARDEAPLLALRLIELAWDIAGMLVARDPAAILHRQLQVEVRCARAHRLLDTADLAAAARELRRAAGQLAPDLGYGRAQYCRALARLRREQRRWEEALALGERAVVLLDDYGSTLEAGQAQVEQGWTLIEAGDPDEALPLLEAAMPLVDGVQPWMVTGRLGLAVAMREGGDLEGAGKLLAMADLLIAEVMEPGMRLHLRRLAAEAARRCGHGCSGLRRLGRVVTGLLARGEDYEAAGALLELLALCVERQWPRAFKISAVQLALDALFESTQLHLRARAVIGFLAYVLHDPGGRRAAEVVPAVSRYLVHSRYRPELPFEPTHGKPLVHLEWDDLEPRVRGSICVEVGAEEDTGRRPGKDIESDLRDFISWRYEVLRRVRIEFMNQDHHEPPAAEASCIRP
jgi:tetratricopeptide (TPR) repeat protein